MSQIRRNFPQNLCVSGTWPGVITLSDDSVGQVLVSNGRSPVSCMCRSLLRSRTEPCTFGGYTGVFRQCRSWVQKGVQRHMVHIFLHIFSVTVTVRRFLVVKGCVFLRVLHSIKEKLKRRDCLNIPVFSCVISSFKYFSLHRKGIMGPFPGTGKWIIKRSGSSQITSINC